jgi:hypothetical protein
MSGATPDDILAVLDQGARDFTFPMLDNGYVYLAATRLSVFSSVADWAIVFEVFGFSPRAGLPDLFVTAFTSRPVHDKIASDFASDEAYRNFLQRNAKLHQDVCFPIEDEDWIDAEDGEHVNGSAASLRLRGETIPLPGPTDYAAAGVKFEDDSSPLVFELCRALAFLRRDAVLATEAERRRGLQPDLRQVLLLEDWHHPDVVDPDALPSGTETFRQLAQVAATGDISQYRTSESPNTHWSNWPFGGTL